MDQSEYERRKQHLEDEEERALDLVRAGFRAQHRGLDMVWAISPENRGSVAQIFDPLPSTAPTALPALARPSARSARRPVGELYRQILAALKSLPEVFDRTDLLPLLDPQPKKSSLLGTLEELCGKRLLQIEQPAFGTRPARYRRIQAGSAEEPAG